jgi:hypothetical protein
MEKNKPNKLLSQLFKISNEDAPVFDTQHLTISPGLGDKAKMRRNSAASRARANLRSKLARLDGYFDIGTAPSLKPPGWFLLSSAEVFVYAESRTGSTNEG